MKKSKVLTAIAVAAMLAMSVTACGGGSSSAAPATSAPAATEAAAATEAVADTEAAEEDTEAAEEDTEEYAEEDTEAAEETQAAVTDLSQLNDILTEAFVGMIDDEGVMLYGGNADGSLAVCAAYDPNTNNYISFVGPIEQVSDTQLQITDSSTGNTLTFSVTPQEDGSIELSMGDFGTAVVQQTDNATLIEMLEKINNGSNPLA